MPSLHDALDHFRHLDVFLNSIATHHPIGVYALLMAIVFCETGLVVTPFLPGDTLLFTVGSLAASANTSLHLWLVVVLLCLAANAGDLLNYAIGYRVGPAVFSRESSWILNKKHLLEAHAFYERHGRKTIILARFVPILRTFAPFVAGIGQMRFSRFIGFSIAGGLFWVVAVTLAGYWLGQIPFVKGHFEIVVLAIVAISVLPVALHAISARRRGATPLAVAASPVVKAPI